MSKKLAVCAAIALFVTGFIAGVVGTSYSPEIKQAAHLISYDPVSKQIAIERWESIKRSTPDRVLDLGWALEERKKDAEAITRMVSNGYVAFSVLGFTQDEMNTRIKALRVAYAAKEYKDIATRSSIRAIDNSGRTVRSIMDRERLEWTDLGVTEEQYLSTVRDAKITMAKLGVTKLKGTERLRAYEAGSLIEEIRLVVKEGAATWQDIGMEEEEFNRVAQYAIAHAIPLEMPRAQADTLAPTSVGAHTWDASPPCSSSGFAFSVNSFSGGIGLGGC